MTTPGRWAGRGPLGHGKTCASVLRRAALQCLPQCLRVLLMLLLAGGVQAADSVPAASVTVPADPSEGHALRLNFHEVDLREALRQLAERAGLDLILGEGVQGRLTLSLSGLSHEQALALIARSRGLGLQREGRVLLVSSASEQAEQVLQHEALRQQQAAREPLHSAVLTLRYAEAMPLAGLFRESLQGGESGELRGSLIADERSNSLIASLPAAQLAALQRLIEALDRPQRQVLIEARIVEANLGFDQSLGVRWGGSLSLAGDGRWSLQGAGFEGSRAPFVDLGVPNRTAGIGLGFLTDNTLLDLQLSAMEKTGNGEVISQPRVVTADRQTARILKGAEVPYSTVSEQGTSVQFKEAALALEVTPQISAAQAVVMTVRVTKDEPDFSSAIDGVPPIKKNEVNARVEVGDGQTLVIGGVFSSQQMQAVEKVPLLGDLPLLGRLFRRDIVSWQKSELLVFLTPRIIDAPAFSVSR